ncbi:hypothetical protein [Cesiribacter andamanensis]|uniref:Uncharacterized protein n=1 Tax=Cesiribacter andamanensis AMV16 TaxID=1279009 RepID=M7MXN5_9BACT|nr:hypothetical protein [Cesiribacter andamanensis]EMR01203.1 hypothetical protein ADICEAN_03683 [Cesiribacter andamanensis AMV16]
MNINTNLVDISILLLSILATAGFCYRLYRHPAFCQRKSFVFLLVFLAMYPLLSMLGHVLAIALISGMRLQNGSFVYDFRFYSLMLFGLTFMLLNGYLLNRIRPLSRGLWQVYPQLVAVSVVQLLLLAPSIPLNPMGLMPCLASLLLIGRLALARRKAGRRLPDNFSVRSYPTTV